ncbi:MAG: DUF1189 family protein [Candidatus Brocadiia bacterium]
MADGYPNYLISIPRSIISLKHYSQVHDQPLTRTVVYVLILGLAITALGVAIGLVGYAREAPHREAERAEELAQALAEVSFQDGRATATGEQPRVAWEDLAEPPPGSEEDQRPPLRRMVLVLDTTGDTTTIEGAAELAGCAEPRRILVFGPKGVASLTRPAEDDGEEERTSWDYSEEEKTAEAVELVEAHGGTVPDYSVDEEGTAHFEVEEARVHVLCHDGELMALANATEREMGPEQARYVVLRRETRRQPPEFLVLLTAERVLLKPIYEDEPRSWEFADSGEASAEAVARWVAATARRAQAASLRQGLLPNVMKMFLGVCMELFFLALVASLVGLIVNGVLRGGLAYAELLTLALYATTPARLIPPFLALAPLPPEVLMALPFAVAMVYTGLATQRTVRAAGSEMAVEEPAPPL